MEVISDYVIGFFVFLWKSSALATWLQSVAIFATGLCALAAAKRAYLGASVQSETAKQIADKQIEIKKNGSAAALAAELGYLMSSLAIVRATARTVPMNLHEHLQSMDHQHPVFDANPQVVSNFDPLTATQVIRAYRSYHEAIKIVHDKIDNYDLVNCPRDRQLFGQEISLRISSCLREMFQIADSLMKLAGVDANAQSEWLDWLNENGVNEAGIAAKL
jgi:hypothetical protein